MKRSKCVNCSEYRRCRDSRASLFFFIIGMISTIAIRAVTVLVHMDPLYGQIAWYIGVGGFFIYFLYKYRVDLERHRLITRLDLKNKIFKGGELERGDREVIGSVLCALSSSRDRLNYFLIFSSSALAIILAVYFDFIKR